MQLPTTRVRLEDLGLIAVRGPEARKFLHGQVSQDVLGQPANHVALAGLHNPQGRVSAILRLVPLGEDGLLLVLPAEIVPAVVQRLRRYVLRAKLTLEIVTDDWLAIGLGGPDAAAELAAVDLTCASATVGALAGGTGLLAWRHAVAPERFILLAAGATALPAALQPADAANVAAVAQRDWHAADIAAGLPQVRAATVDAFVAQMLNLDVLHAISFQKGCYTGQEVIARAHYRGRVKRRLQRFRTLAAEPLSLAAGDLGTLPDGRGFRVVDAVVLADGRSEWLAVAALQAAAAEDDMAAASSGADGKANASAALRPGLAVRAEALPLPYDLPD